MILRGEVCSFRDQIDCVHPHAAVRRHDVRGDGHLEVIELKALRLRGESPRVPLLAISNLVFSNEVFE